MMDPIQAILDDLRAGKMILLVDDEKRENEGDLVCAASAVTPEVVNFMLREARGMLCVALASDVCDRLDLVPQSTINNTQRSTAYTVSVDAHERFGVTTGVSASDRAVTIRTLIDPASRPTDFARPGHTHPLRARDGGVLVRAGQTEGSVDLCRLAGLPPGAAIIEVMNDDGSMARLPDLKVFCKKHSIKMCSVADVIQHRLGSQKLVERADEAPIDTAAGRFRLIAYRSLVDPLPHVALVCGDIGKRDAQGNPVQLTEPVLVRMHSQNLLGDVFGDAAQPSGQTLHQAMRMIQKQGCGAVVYLRHEGMGSGLLRRLQTLHETLDQPGHNPERVTIGSGHQTPGIHPPADKRDYGIGCQVLRDLGIRKLRLITNHPFTPTALQGFGLEISEFVRVDDRV